MSNDAQGPLAGIRVIDMSTTLPGAFAGQFLSDAGADVLQVERPGGSPLRKLVAWPAYGRGKRSVVLDLHDPGDRARLDDLLAGADVLLTTFAPARNEELGFTAQRLAELNPRLVSAAITGWGSTGPWRDLKGYEALVLAKIGYLHGRRKTTMRPGPAFVSVPFASWGAAQTAVQGILAALVEREDSGFGQHVEADLLHGVSTIDPYQWFVELVSKRWPDAYEPAEAFDDDGRPLGRLTLPLLTSPTKDGYWLQFAQVDPRLFQAFLTELGLMPLLADPKWKGFPDLDAERLSEFRDMMIQRCSQRTLAEWQQVFETDPNIFAEIYRGSAQTMDHPQLVHDKRVTTVDDPDLGPVRQMTTLVHADGGPLVPLRPAPRLGEHTAEATAGTKHTVPAPDGPAPARLPLEGVTILELSKMFAAPYGATLLTDLGARVIKVESLEGDQIRFLNPFPEATGAKVLQGKESVALDLTTEDGRRIVHDIARHCDMVLESFRAGAATRLGVDEAALKAVNPDLVYVHAPGYGTDGPLGDRPAYAPSIGAGGGLALTDVPDAAAATNPAEDLDPARKAGARLFGAASSASLQADGLAALAVASALTLGLFAAKRGRRYTGLTTTMLATVNHVISEWNTDYAGKPQSPTADAGAHGYSALYRLYEASDGWVFLAAPADGEWGPLVAALKGYADLGSDPRFGSPQDRAKHDAELAGTLAAAFAKRAKADWEAELTSAGVGCVAVMERTAELVLMDDECFEAGYSATATHPVFEEHRRLAAVVRFSRSLTKTDGGCSVGEHTDAVLREIGYSDERLDDLRARKVIG